MRLISPFFLLLIVATFSCRHSSFFGLSDDSGVVLEEPDVANGFVRLFLNSGGRSCTGAFVQHNAVLVSSRCIGALNRNTGGNGVYFMDAKDKKNVALDVFSLNKGGEFIAANAESAPAAARYGLAVVVFEDNAFTAAGFSEPYVSVSSRGASDVAGQNELFFIGHSQAGGPASLLLTAPTMDVDHYADYFVAPIPNVSASDVGALAVNWDETGAFVLDVEHKIVGVVAARTTKSIHVKGQPTAGNFAFVTNMRSPLVFNLYQEAILCNQPSRRCAAEFPNSGILRKPRLSEETYASRDRERCRVKLTQQRDEKDVNTVSVTLAGLGDQCVKYQSVFNQCYDNQCFSPETCESLKILPDGFELLTRGKTYRFAKGKYVPEKALDSLVPLFSISDRKDCFITKIAEGGTTQCRADGGKWLSFDSKSSWKDNDGVCTKYNFLPLKKDRAAAFASDVKPGFGFWVSGIPTMAELAASGQQSVFIRRGYYTFSGNAPKFEFKEITESAKAGIACECPVN